MMSPQAALPGAGGAATLSPIGDTVRMPWSSTDGPDEFVVRPALAILFRLALGSAAETFAPRFLRYERTGRAGVHWHWPAFVFPAAWAFYRRLWVPGIVFVAMPLLLAALFSRLDTPVFDSALAWLACAVAFVWGLPGIAGALLADPLLYVSVRDRVRQAEAASERADDVAAALCRQYSTAPWAALVLGGASLAALFEFALPGLQVQFGQHVVRSRVAATLAAVAPLKRQVEEAWNRSAPLPRQPDYAGVKAQRGAAFLDTVDLSPRSGRVRLGLGSALGALSGKTLLLVPALDARDEIRWYCIAVDAPAKLLPQECRNG